MKIGIIGGGISGLATAFNLENLNGLEGSQSKIANLEIDIYEAESRLGGSMKTEKINDFLFEHGVNGYITNKPDMDELVQRVGAEQLLLRSNDLARIRYIFTDALHLLPESPPAFFTSKLLTLKGKLRVMAEPFIKAKTDDKDETLESFGYRRVGKELTDKVLNAMIAGVFASAPEKISVNSAFPLVANLEKEHGGLFRGMLKKRKKSAGPGGVLMSFKGGVTAFVEFLASKLSANIFLNAKVDRIEKLANSYKIFCGDQVKEYDKIVLATPAFISANLVASFDENLSKKLADIEYSPIGVIGFGYENLDHQLNGFGLLTPALAKKKILGVLWDSSVFCDRAPDGKKSLRVMIGGQRDKELLQKSEAELIEIARQGIEETMGASAKAQATFARLYQKGIPNYNVGHSALVEEIFTKAKAHKGLYLNSNAYKGVALNDCSKNSKICAEQILQDAT